MAKFTKCAFFLCMLSISGCLTTSPHYHKVTAEEKLQRQQFLKGIQYHTETELISDLHDIIQNPFKKQPFETDNEFRKRKAKEFYEYNHKGYILNMKISNPKNISTLNKKAVQVYFNPDQSKLVIAMPERRTPFVNLGRKNQLFRLHCSYLNIETLNESFNSYIASNGFGRQVTVYKIREESIGLAILNSVAGYSAPPQTFSIQMQRNLAQQLLKDCRLELNIFVDNRYSNFNNSTMLVNVRDWSDHWEDPTTDYPYDIDRLLYGIPVRMTAIKLYDNNDKIIAEWKGQQIFSISVSD